MIAHMLLAGSKNFILMGIQHEKKIANYYHFWS